MLNFTYGVHDHRSLATTALDLRESLGFSQVGSEMDLETDSVCSSGKKVWKTKLKPREDKQSGDFCGSPGII